MTAPAAAANEHAALLTSANSPTVHQYGAVEPQQHSSTTESSSPLPVTVDGVQLARAKEQRALTGAMLFCVLFMCIELVGGYVSHSLAILTDALHLMTDVGAYALSIFALIAAGRAASEKYSYGWHRAEVLGTLFSVFTIWGLAGAICLEAVGRTWNIVECARIPSAQHYYYNGTMVDPTPSPHGGKRAATQLRDTTADLAEGGSGSHAVQDAIASCVPIDSKIMIVVGILGMLVNIGCACILYFGGSHGHSHLGGGKCGGDHGHSHGGGDDHGHSHGGGAGDDHGHSHAGDDDHSHDECHGHDHGGHDDDRHEHEDPSHASVEFKHSASLQSVDECGDSAYDEYEHSVGADPHGHSHGGDGATGRKKGFAIHAAFLHALGDCVQSLGVILAGVFIYVANVMTIGTPNSAHSIYNLADPLSSIVFALVTLKMTKNLIFDILAILMESTPQSVDYQKLGAALAEIDGVVSVHDLHVWSLAQDFTACSVHLVANNHVEVLYEAQRICEEEFHISHHTVQVDPIQQGSGRCHKGGGSCAALVPAVSSTLTKVHHQQVEME